MDATALFLRLAVSSFTVSALPMREMVSARPILSAASPAAYTLGRGVSKEVFQFHDMILTVVCYSWNRKLTRERGLAMGGEFKKKGVNVLLGPVAGPLGRIALGGRNWEGFGPDPYLAGALVYKSIEGIQSQGVITSTKVC